MDYVVIGGPEHGRQVNYPGEYLEAAVWPKKAAISCNYRDDELAGGYTYIEKYLYRRFAVSNRDNRTYIWIPDHVPAGQEFTYILNMAARGQGRY